MFETVIMYMSIYKVLYSFVGIREKLLVTFLYLSYSYSHKLMLIILYNDVAV